VIRARRGLILAAAALSAYVLVVLFLIGAGIWSGVDQADRAALNGIISSQMPLIVIGAVLLIGGLTLIQAWVFARYVDPLRRMAADTRLMTSANRKHRLGVHSPPELASLADAINELAGRYQASDEEISGRVAEARAQLAEERNRLAALMAELTIPVLVCTADGRILLYNQAARELLSEAYVGLGRSIFGILDRTAFTHVLDQISAGTGRSNAITTTSGQRLLRVHVTPIAGPDTDVGGVVLTMEDLTRRASAVERRDAALRGLTEQTRGAIANIRAAVETMLDYPDMDADAQRRFATIIQDEAGRLSARVEQATATYSEQVSDPSLLEDVLARDLVTAIEHRLRDGRTAISGSVDMPPDDLWLSTDSAQTIRTVVDLVDWLRGKHGVDNVEVSVQPLDRYAALDIRWQGPPLESAAMAEWSNQPSVRGWLERHGYETWSGQDQAGSYVRLLLARARDIAPPARRDDATIQGPRPPTERPEFYDFDLFRVTEETAEWDARRLADLAYTVFDTETTGLSPDEGDEIISIGAVRVVNRRVLTTETFEQLVDPRRRISAASYAVHGISSDMVRGQPVITEVLPGFARFAEDTVLVGHEVGFDLRFISHKEQEAGVRFTQPALDTRLLSAIINPEHERHSLETIAERLGVSVVGRHTALGDALVTAEVFVRLLDLLENRGLRTLGEVRAAASRATIATSFSP
jgi:DNA polymerase III subunit epsilon